MGKKKDNVDEDDVNVNVNDLAATTYANIARLTRMGYIAPDHARWALGILPLERKDRFLGSWKQDMRVLDVDSTDTVRVHRLPYDSERWRWVCHNEMADGWVSLHDLRFTAANPASQDSASSSRRTRYAEEPPAPTATRGKRGKHRAPSQDTSVDSFSDARYHLRHQPAELAGTENRFKDPPSLEEYPRNAASYYQSSRYHFVPEGCIDKSGTGCRREADIAHGRLEQRRHAQQSRQSDRRHRKRTRFEDDEQPVDGDPPRSRKKRIESGDDTAESEAAHSLLQLKS
ncbi:unnamed protein product [Peniophora sp. CBMAI 1063]|nr:unnamed protein product [Peniophora sp. CBMAI 1063]